MLRWLKQTILMIILTCTVFLATAQVNMTMPDHVYRGATKRYQVEPNPNSPSTYIWWIDGVIQSGATTHVIDITWTSTLPNPHILEVQEISADGCQGQKQSGEVFVVELGLAATGTNSVICNLPGRIDFTFTNVPDGTYTIDYTGGSFTNVIVSDNKASVPAPSGNYANLSVTISGITSPLGVNVTITAPLNLVRPLIAVNKTVSCHGGSDGELIVTIADGTPNYYYSFDGGTTWSAEAYPSPIVVPGLSAGLYAITVKDANDCLSPSSPATAVSEPGQITAIITGTNPDCTQGSSGTATVSASGGTAPYTYLWSNGQTTPVADNLPPGNYTVTITDSNNCSITVNHTVVRDPDVTKPLFTLPEPFIACVEDLRSVRYDPVSQQVIYDQPDYYTFKPGDLQLDLNPALFTDNCDLNCQVEIRWRIDFSPAPGTIPPHDMITQPPVTGTGQPSEVTGTIQFPGDGVNFNEVVHHITYWIVDCSGNVSEPMTQTITIRPRPNIINAM